VASCGLMNPGISDFSTAAASLLTRLTIKPTQNADLTEETLTSEAVSPGLKGNL
jgi:hypothetical protein